MSILHTLTTLPRVPSSAVQVALRRGVMTASVLLVAVPVALADEGRAEISVDGLPSAAEAGARAQLMRKWDLNADGRIDDGEAEVARARMKRERRDMQRNAGNDPLTGRPRGEKEQAAIVAADAAGRGASEHDEAEMPSDADDDSPRLPGTTSPQLAVPVPAPKPPVVGSPQGIPRASIYGRPPAAARQASGPVTSPSRQPIGGQRGSGTDPQSGPQAGLGSRAGWTGRWTQPLTGGARAGAPAAAAGYGATGPTRDLNAGRYREDLPSLQGLTPRLDVSGGLLPTVRQPRQPVAPPVALPVKPPRLTAEDIGGF